MVFSSTSTAAISCLSESSTVGKALAIVSTSPASLVTVPSNVSAKQIGSNVAKELPVPALITLPSLSTLVKSGAPPVSSSKKPDSGNALFRQASLAIAAASSLNVTSVRLLVPLPPGTLSYSNLDNLTPPFTPMINSESGM